MNFYLKRLMIVNKKPTTERIKIADDLEFNLMMYCGDIKKFTKQKDYTSALRLVSGLRNFILDEQKKNKKNMMQNGSRNLNKKVIKNV